jgi:hypothetical protein
MNHIFRPAFPSVLPEGMCYNEEGLSRVEYYALHLLAARLSYGSTSWEEDAKNCVALAIELDKEINKHYAKSNPSR